MKIFHHGLAQLGTTFGTAADIVKEVWMILR